MAKNRRKPKKSTTEQQTPPSFGKRLWAALHDQSLAYGLLFIGAFVGSFEGDPLHVAEELSNVVDRIG